MVATTNHGLRNLIMFCSLLNIPRAIKGTGASAMVPLDLSLLIAARLQCRCMAGFDDAWSAVAGLRNGRVSPELLPLLRQVYLDILAEPVNLASLKKSLEALIEYLSLAGRTNANCWAVDRFFSTSEGWERDWTEQDLPD